MTVWDRPDAAGSNPALVGAGPDPFMARACRNRFSGLFAMALNPKGATAQSVLRHRHPPACSEAGQVDILNDGSPRGGGPAR